LEDVQPDSALQEEHPGTALDLPTLSAVSAIKRAICAVPISEIDGERFDLLVGPSSMPLPYEAFKRGEMVTPGMWALYLALLA
jgi:hypothetical protein